MGVFKERLNMLSQKFLWRWIKLSLNQPGIEINMHIGRASISFKLLGMTHTPSMKLE